MTDDAQPLPPLDLSPVERRVLGVLMEKALATPEYYPLTLKALVAGCNQKSNREPVLDLSDEQVEEGLAGLRARGLVMSVRTDSGWATRWRHEVDRKLGIQGRELAVLAELLLRGPQTEGELRTRAGRMVALQDLEAVHEVLDRMRSATPPLVVRLTPEGVVRGVRYADTLQPASELAASRDRAHAAPSAEPSSAPPASGLAERVARLEARVARLESELGVPPGDAS